MRTQGKIIHYSMSVTSKTDDTVAPEGHDNLFLLIPSSRAGGR